MQLICPGDHTLCLACVKAHPGQCAVCACELPSDGPIYQNETVALIVSNLDVRCSTFGCSWTGLVSEFELHASVCSAAGHSLPSPSSTSEPELGRIENEDEAHKTKEELIEAILRERKKKAELRWEEQQLIRALENVRRLDDVAFNERRAILDVHAKLDLARSGIDPRVQSSTTSTKHKFEVSLAKERAEIGQMLKVPSDGYIFEGGAPRVRKHEGIDPWGVSWRAIEQPDESKEIDPVEELGATMDRLVIRGDPRVRVSRLIAAPRKRAPAFTSDDLLAQIEARASR